VNHCHKLGEDIYPFYAYPTVGKFKVFTIYLRRVIPQIWGILTPKYGGNTLIYWGKIGGKKISDCFYLKK
jgi:hypothetical protein